MVKPGRDAGTTIRNLETESGTGRESSNLPAKSDLRPFTEERAVLRHHAARVVEEIHEHLREGVAVDPAGSLSITDTLQLGAVARER